MIIQFRSNEFQTIYRIESISFQNIFCICFIMNQELRTKMVSISKLFQVVMCDKFCNFGYLAFYYFCLVFILNHVSCFHITYQVTFYITKFQCFCFLFYFYTCSFRSNMHWEPRRPYFVRFPKTTSRCQGELQNVRFACATLTRWLLAKYAR